MHDAISQQDPAEGARLFDELIVPAFGLEEDEVFGTSIQHLVPR